MKCIITQQDAKTGLTRKELGDRKYPISSFRGEAKK